MNHKFPLLQDKGMWIDGEDCEVWLSRANSSLLGYRMRSRQGGVYSRQIAAAFGRITHPKMCLQTITPPLRLYNFHGKIDAIQNLANSLFFTKVDVIGTRLGKLPFLKKAMYWGNATTGFGDSK
jgi:hypothetical protein